MRDKLIPILRLYKRNLTRIDENVTLPEDVYPRTEPLDEAIIKKLFNDCWKLMEKIELNQSATFLKNSFALTQYSAGLERLSKIRCEGHKELDDFLVNIKVSSEGMQGLLPNLKWEVDLLATYLYFLSGAISNSYMTKAKWPRMKKKHIAKLSLEYFYSDLKTKFGKLAKGFYNFLIGTNNVRMSYKKMIINIKKAKAYIHSCSEDDLNIDSHVNEYLKEPSSSTKQINVILLNSLDDQKRDGEPWRSYCVTKLTHLYNQVFENLIRMSKFCQLLIKYRKNILLFVNYKLPINYKQLYMYEKRLNVIQKLLRVYGIRVRRR